MSTGHLQTLLAETQTVIVVGPKRTGKYQLLLSALGHAATRAIVVSTDRSPDTLRSTYRSIVGQGCEPLVVVNCTGSDRPADVDPNTITASARNLTEVGVATIKGANEFRPGNAAVGIHSLSHLILTTSTTHVYRFVRTLMANARSQRWPVVGVANSRMHTDQTLNTLIEPFDAVIRTRHGDECNEYQLQTRDGSRSAWLPHPIT